MKWFALALIALAALLPGEASAQGSPVEAALQPAVWQGTAECPAGTTYVKVSTDLSQLDPDAQRGNARIELSKSPGGVPDAMGLSSLRAWNDQISLAVRLWRYRPLDFSQLLGQERAGNAALKPSEDGEELTSDKFFACTSLKLKKVPRRLVEGAIDSAADLPRELIGTIGCSDRAPYYALVLKIEPSGDTDFDGQLTFVRPHSGATGDVGAFEVFGEYDAETGQVTVIGDQWVRKTPALRDVFDFTASVRDGGQRLVGQSSWTSCGVVDLHVAGTDPSERIYAMAAPVPVADWDTPSACVTLSHWARQAWVETEGKSPYDGMTVGRAREIAIGLFADERFVPFFGKPFAELSAEERKRVNDVAQSCFRQLSFSDEFAHSGAHQFVTDFFPDHRSGEWIKLKRFRLLRGRLSKDMAELADKAVSESDIEPLKERLAGLDERFDELWTADLAAARALIESKIYTAQGAMIDRLKGEIDELPEDLRAFEAESHIRGEVAWLGEDRKPDQDALNAQLDDKLATAADRVLGDVAAGFDGKEPALGTLAELTAKVENPWPRIGSHVDRGGAGFQKLNAHFERFADALFDAFNTKVRSMIDSQAEFYERVGQYEATVHYHNRLVPSGPQFAPLFERYNQTIAALRPEPTFEDLVDDDGSPSSLGMKFAVSDYVETYWSASFSLLPFDLSFVTNSVYVSNVRKISCDAAEGQDGFWCRYDLNVGGPLPMVDAIVSMVSYEARFVLRGQQWELVETKGDGGGGVPYSSNDFGNQSYGFMDMRDPMQLWGASIMMNIK